MKPPLHITVDKRLRYVSPQLLSATSFIRKPIDDLEEDDKIIAVHADDPEYNHYNDISELPSHKIKELERFFLDYKKLEKKERIVKIERFSGRSEAEKILLKSIELYKKTFF